MAFNSVWDMSTTPGSNGNVGGANIAESCPPSGINDGMRAMIAQYLGALLTVTAGGTADAVTATLVPAPAALVNGMMVRIRAASANATTTPTFAPNALTAHTITKNGNQALAAGDISGAGHELFLAYNSTNTVWELLNPKEGTGTVTSVATAGLATGGAITTTGTVTVTASSKAQMQAATDNTTGVTPVRVNDHDGAAKAWVNFIGASGTTNKTYNVSSVSRSSAGVYIVNFTAGFTDALYVAVVSVAQTSRVGSVGTQTTGNCTINVTDLAASAADATNVHVAFFGRN